MVAKTPVQNMRMSFLNLCLLYFLTVGVSSHLPMAFEHVKNVAMGHIMLINANNVANKNQSFCPARFDKPVHVERRMNER